MFITAYEIWGAIYHFVTCRFLRMKLWPAHFPNPKVKYYPMMPEHNCLFNRYTVIHSREMLKGNTGFTFPIDTIFSCTNIPVTPTVLRATIKNTPCTSPVFCVKIHSWHHVTETYIKNMYRGEFFCKNFM